MVSEKELERLENLPKRIGCSKEARYNNYYWKHSKRRFQGRCIYDIANKIIEANVGKDFDLTFSYFCKQIGYNQQWYDCFLREFTIDNARRRYALNSIYCGYWVDDNRLIQVTNYEKTNNPYIWKSDDYKVEERYISDDKRVEGISWTERRKRELSKDKTYNFILSGSIKSYPFNSRIAIKLRAEKQQKHKKLYKQLLKSKKEFQYCFMTKSEIQIKQDRELNWVNRDRFGFDENSFKGMYYHGQKRKLKE